MALAQSSYGHFFIEHNRGHHVRVATPEDPASRAAGGELLRLPAPHRGGLPALRLGARAHAPGARGPLAVDAAQRRPRGVGDDRRPVRGARGRVRPGRAALPAGPGGARLLPAGGRQLPGALRPAARQRREDGRYERTQPEHCWNSNNVASNVLLYHLQRHSDHHANPVRRYQALRHVDEAPQLPTGYCGDDPARRVAPAVAAGDGPAAPGALRGATSARANIAPRRRPRVLARYGATP